ncbi:MAG: hypothetical protein LAT75_07895 [Candidatus Cyclonatronum sp.]|uniref:hypothetical protein n=1 Tax=Cyclonatronum sp. TaxID=3024185 RepID=UPI0025B7C52B|nr:hypothetical protein [Cyclonatronum sp.]MCH8486772.1 hypothetical protein [Cyclonatronum sp.]
MVTIIVGIATVVAINIFGTSATQANEDAVRQDMITIAAQAQAWYARPEMLGGGGRKYDDFDFSKIGFACDFETTGEGDNATTNFDECENENGLYTFAEDGQTITFTGTPSTGGLNFVLAVSGSQTNFSFGDRE